MFGLVPFNRRNGLSARRDLFNLDNFFDNFFSDSFAGFFTAAHPIKADVKETDKEYIIEADMPGVKKEDIRFELENGVLTLGGSTMSRSTRRGKLHPQGEKVRFILQEFQGRRGKGRQSVCKI